MRELRTRLRQFTHLTAADRREVYAAAVILPLFAAVLSLCGLTRLRAWIERRPIRVQDAVSIENIRSVALAINIAAWHSPIRVRCLTRSVYLVWRLRRLGVAAELQIGVAVRLGAFSAHAWVEYEGIPINDRADIRFEFVSFGELPPASTFIEP